MERIRGGWKNVPDNLKTKTMLDQIGMKPSGDPVAEVWSGHQWCKLYDTVVAIPKNRISDKQQEALEKARAKAITDRTCSHCDEVVSKNEINIEVGGARICDWCKKHLVWEAEQKSMISAGHEQFRCWFEQDFVILDTETTDLEGEIVEISIIDRTGETLFHSLVKPVHPVPDDSIATEIHGITNAELEDAPTWADIRDNVQGILRGREILAFNAEFDLKMLNHSCDRSGMPRLDELKWNCVMEAYRLTQCSEKWISLASASGRVTAHRATEDCQATLTVIENQWKALGLIPSVKINATA